MGSFASSAIDPRLFAKRSATKMLYATLEFLSHAYKTLKEAHVVHGFVTGVAPLICRTSVELLSLEKAFAAIVAKGIKLPAGLPKIVSNNLRHVYDIQKTFRRKNGKLVFDWTGFHVDRLDVLKTQGLLEEIGMRVTHATGAFKTNINFGGVVHGKSFFPPAWSDVKILEKTIEACENLVKAPIRQSNGNFRLHGVTSEGLEIMAVLTQAGELHTFFPIIN